MVPAAVFFASFSIDKQYAIGPLRAIRQLAYAFSVNLQSSVPGFPELRLPIRRARISYVTGLRKPPPT